MRDELLPYYERELRYIRRLAAGFAERYPAVASQLLLEPEKCEDPHVERLIEAFSMLSARIRLKLDDEFPQISDSLLGIVHPSAVTPIPSTTIVRFDLDPEWAKEGEGLSIPRGTQLQTKSVEGVRCKFRTCYPVTLWPVRVDTLSVEALGEREKGCPPGTAGAVRLRLKTFGGRSFASVGVDELAFQLDRDSVVVQRLYELIFRAPRGVLVREPKPTAEGAIDPVFLEADRLAPVGFGQDEGLLPDRSGASQGYRLLMEYFSFPDKFHGFRLSGLARALSRIRSDTADLLVLLDEYPIDLQGKLEPGNVLLGCTPAVNLFEQEADPIRLTETDLEYRIVPDVHGQDAFEVHSLLEVSSLAPRSGKEREFRPFYGLRHGDQDPSKAAFWHAERRASSREGDAGSEMWILLVDRHFGAIPREAGEVLNVRALCTNRDLPTRLPLGTGEADELRVEGKPGVTAVQCIRKPTRSIRPELGSEGRWKIVSHLSLNFLSIVDSEAGGQARSDLSGVGSGSAALDSFRELLKLYDFTASPVTRQRIAGLVGVESRPVLRRIRSAGMPFHARGLEVTLRLDEGAFTGSSAFLFASVLERFLAHYTSINSFVQTVAEVRQREGVLKRWPPRAGAKSLL
jgi:type VI secretion system protein ImpG